jgi:cobalamin biosynthesis Mg chelatase CobN
MAPMKRLLLLSVLAAVVVAIPAQARAAEPCRNKVFNDWYADGKIASTYPHACYVSALRHIPADATVYSSLGDDIRSAMRAALNRANGESVPAQVGHGFASLTSGHVKGVSTTKSSTPHDPAPSSNEPSSSSSTVAVGDTSSSSGLPIPIIILGALALVLAGAGAIGSGVRYARSRRPGA